MRLNMKQYTPTRDSTAPDQHLLLGQMVFGPPGKIPLHPMTPSGPYQVPRITIMSEDIAMLEGKIKVLEQSIVTKNTVLEEYEKLIVDLANRFVQPGETLREPLLGRLVFCAANIVARRIPKSNLTESESFAELTASALED